ncbi:MAG: D-Ala-D-Ala carboxypeptidase family metallohydrolase [Bacteroidota bacterium]
MKKYWLLPFAVVLCPLALLLHWPLLDRCWLRYYDWTHHNPPVHHRDELRTRLTQYERIPYAALGAPYLTATKSDQGAYADLLRSSQYYRIRREHLYQKVVGDFRLRDFICKDQYYQQCLRDGEVELRVLLDEKMLLKTLELQEALRKRNADPQGFSIVNGYRHPAYNERVGGAPASRHLLGQAVDIAVGDVNRDGRTDQQDKRILLEILENEVIKDGGGIGRYPGTLTIHYDVRGRRARWDRY